MGYRDYDPEDKANSSLQRLGTATGDLIRERHEAADLLDAMLGKGFIDREGEAGEQVERFIRVLRGDTDGEPQDGKATAQEAITAVRQHLDIEEWLKDCGSAELERLGVRSGG